LVLLGTWLHDAYDVHGVVAEKHEDTVQGYRTVNLRSGEAEQPLAVSMLYDRREALAQLQQRAAQAFPSDPSMPRIVLEIASPFVQPNIIYNINETEWRRVQAQGAVPSTV